ncbi:MAG: hypothetical protein AB1758_02470 [Candidatus Eremiobacterota bacterium]
MLDVAGPHDDVVPNRVRVQAGLVEAGYDEAPWVYRDVAAVLAAHGFLQPVAEFRPRVIRMAPPGSTAED